MQGEWSVCALWFKGMEAALLGGWWGLNRQQMTG